MGANRDIYLEKKEMPDRWYNFMPALPGELPEALDYESGVTDSQKKLMESIRPSELVRQDKCREEWIDIPEEILVNLYKAGRPTPLRRALELEKYLDTPARIYFKREDTMLTGSFKLSTAIAQAYYCKKEGFQGIVTETGAGQWGMAAALVSRFYDLKCRIYMARCSMEQKPYRRIYVNLLGAEMYPSPSTHTDIGKKLRAENEAHPGSIGSAISDAVEDALRLEGYAYLSGSNVPHVLIHQTLLGQEVKRQLEKAGEAPDELIACVSGGSNFGGLILPFLKEKTKGGKLRFIGAESTAAPRLTKGCYAYDNSDLAGYLPKTKSYTMGHDFVPDPVHVGGLRQHNGSPVIGLLRRQGLVEGAAFTEEEAFRAAEIFLKTEGILAAPESSHAVAAAVASALACKERGEKKNIVFLLSGSGWLDMEGYQEVLLHG